MTDSFRLGRSGDEAGELKQEEEGGLVPRILDFDSWTSTRGLRRGGPAHSGRDFGSAWVRGPAVVPARSDRPEGRPEIGRADASQAGGEGGGSWQSAAYIG